MKARKLGIDEFVRFGLMLIALLLPLIFSPSSLWRYDFPKLIFLQITVVCLLVLWIVKVVSEGKVKLVRTPLNLPVLAFLLAVAISTFTSISFHTSLLGEGIKYHGLLTLLIYVLLFYLPIHFFERKRDVKLFLWAVVVSSVIVSIVGLLQHLGFIFGRWHLFFFLDPKRIMGTMGNPVSLGAYLVLVLPLSLVLFLGQRELFPRAQFSRFLAWVALPLLVACLVFTYSRAAWLASLASFAFLFLFLSKRFLFPLKRTLLMIVGVLAVLLIFQGLPKFTEFKGPSYSPAERALSAVNLGEGSIASRLLMWRISLRVASGYPLFGSGPDTFALATPPYRPVEYGRVIEETARFSSPHNDFLEIAATMGSLGLSTHLWMVITFFGVAFSMVRKVGDELRLLVAGILAAVVGYLIQVQFSFHYICAAPLFWMLMGTALALGKIGGFPSFRIAEFDFLPRLSGNARFAICVLVAFVGVGLISLSVGLFIADRQAARALAYYKAGFYEGAFSAIKCAEKLNPYEERYFFMETRICRAKAERDGSLFWWEKAIGAARRALALNHRDRDAFATLADTYLASAEAGNKEFLDEAILAYKEMIEFEPNHSQSHYNLGVAYYLKGELDEAVAEWEEAARLKPAEVDAYRMMAKVCEKKGDTAIAIRAYKKVLQLDPDNSEALEGLKRLGES
ncbi:MAG: O-antigen ligase family protein [Actinomycetota bacterium]|nr:O-antigen ligase family protein [Actinomycetota bacterium]